MEMIERARELAAEMRPAMIDFAQKGIRCPSLPGEERAFAQLVLKELQTLGYEATCVDDWGNVMGMVRGNAEGPTIMYNAHLDHVDIGDPSEWGILYNKGSVATEALASSFGQARPFQGGS